MIVVAGIAVTVLLGLGVYALVRFAAWRHGAYERAGKGSTVVGTSMGPVEYGTSGQGPVVLLLHGGAGGWDAGLALGEDLGLAASMTVLSPSRAGYLGTPLETCRTPEEAADASAALLDELKIDDVAVLGISGGGPTALQFALRHPARTRALIMLAALSRRYTPPKLSDRGLARLIFYSRGGLWFVDLVSWLIIVHMMRWRPSWVARRCFEGSETLDAEAIRRRVAQFRRDPDQVRWLRLLMWYLLPVSLRKSGIENDLAQYARMDEYPVERISCPTLVVHGRHDGNVPFDHAEFVAGGVPGAELYVVEDCGHLLWLSEHADEMRSRVVDFLGSRSRNTHDVRS